jgi:hypothetical protein
MQIYFCILWGRLMADMRVIAKIKRYLAGLAPHAGESEVVDLLREAVAEIELFYSVFKNHNGWLPIATAPRDRRVLVYTGAEVYAAHWVQSMDTGHEAWMVADKADGLQAVVTATHWQPAPIYSE